MQIETQCESYDAVQNGNWNFLLNYFRLNHYQRSAYCYCTPNESGQKYGLEQLREIIKYSKEIKKLIISAYCTLETISRMCLFSQLFYERMPFDEILKAFHGQRLFFFQSQPFIRDEQIVFDLFGRCDPN